MSDVCQDDECPICLDPLKRRSKALSCGHRFHPSCIKMWFAASISCPCCRRGAVEAIKRNRNVGIDTAFSKILSRVAFPDAMSDHDRIRDVITNDTVMSSFRVDLVDRAFLLSLCDISNDADHFLDMLRRLRSEFR